MEIQMDKAIKMLMYALGIAATSVFLISKNADALFKLTSYEYSFGDLYRFCKIKEFRPGKPICSMPVRLHDNIAQGDSIDSHLIFKDGDLLLIGDSFSFCDWGQKPFHVQLSQGLGRPVFSIYNHHHMHLWQCPYVFLASQTSNHSKTILIYEIVERSILENFSSPIKTNGIDSEINVSWRRQLKNALLSNTEERQETLLKHNCITSPVISFWNTAVFELFRQMPAETPLYSLDPPFLFFKDETTCFQTVHDDELISRLANNIAEFNNTLSERFNCTLVFIPIPNKITIYSKLATKKPYDDFLPRLYNALKSRGVCTVNILQEFKNDSQLVYWPTDTHWNDRGIKIAVRQTMASFSRLPTPTPQASPVN
jgi:hypothetical protein